MRQRLRQQDVDLLVRERKGQLLVDRGVGVRAVAAHGVALAERREAAGDLAHRRQWLRGAARRALRAARRGRDERHGAVAGVVRRRHEAVGRREVGAGGEERLVHRSDALLRARTNQQILTTGLEPAIFALGGRRLVH